MIVNNVCTATLIDWVLSTTRHHPMDWNRAGLSRPIATVSVFEDLSEIESNGRRRRYEYSAPAYRWIEMTSHPAMWQFDPIIILWRYWSKVIDDDSVPRKTRMIRAGADAVNDAIRAILVESVERILGMLNMDREKLRFWGNLSDNLAPELLDAATVVNLKYPAVEHISVDSLLLLRETEIDHGVQKMIELLLKDATKENI